MLHTFLRLMELDCFSDPARTGRCGPDPYPEPDILILDLDLPDLRALEIANEVHRTTPTLPVIFLTNQDPFALPVDGPVLRKPDDRFEELLRLFEIVLAMEG